MKKALGFLDIFSVAAGAMISSGLFVLPAIAFKITGPSIVLAYFLAGLLMLPSMLVKAELSTAMPKAGGAYFYIERALGSLAGTIGGMANWFSISMKSAFALIGIGAFVQAFCPGAGELYVKLLAAFFCLVFTVVNLFSVKGSGRLQTVLVFVLISILVFFVVSGKNKFDVTKFSPFLYSGWKGVFAVAGMVFISYGGLTKIASIAEETKNPGKTIPAAMLAAFFVVEALYVASVAVTVGVLPTDVLKSTLIPLSLASKEIAGVFGFVIVSLAAIIAFVTTANAGLLSASRVPLAMSRDSLLPRIFSKTSKAGIPYVSVAFTSAFMLLVIMFLHIYELVEVASTLMVFLFMLENVALIIMRISRIQAYRPKFKVPLFPWLQILTIIIYGFLIAEMGTVSLTITGCFVAMSGMWYLFYVRPRVDRKSAAYLLIYRAVDRKIADGRLEVELRKIIFEREGVEPDEIQKILLSSFVMELKGESYTDAFRQVAEVASQKLGLEAAHLYTSLINREKSSSTVVHKGVAIPHVVIPGQNKFLLVLARSKGGIKFPTSKEPVHALFFLFGTRDMRNLHLKVLFKLANQIQEKNFMKNWLSATSSEQLKNLLIL